MKSYLSTDATHLSQQSGQPGVVGSSPDETHGKDGVVSHLGVRVVRELAQHVEDVQLRVRDGDEAESEGHGSPDGGLAVAKEVAEMTEGHLRPDVFAHRDQGQAKDGHSLLS